MLGAPTVCSRPEVRRRRRAREGRAPGGGAAPRRPPFERVGREGGRAVAFWSRLFGRRGSGDDAPDGGEYVYLRCNGVRNRACGEPIRVRINPRTDLEQEFTEDGADAPTGYVLNKDVLGNRCQNMMRLTIHYDARKRELNRAVE